MYRGVVYAKLGHYFRSIGDLTKAMEESKWNSDISPFIIRYNRSVAFVLMGDDGSALADIQKLLTMVLASSSLCPASITCASPYPQKASPALKARVAEQSAILNRRLDHWITSKNQYTVLWSNEEKEEEVMHEVG